LYYVEQVSSNLSTILPLTFEPASYVLTRAAISHASPHSHFQRSYSRYPRAYNLNIIALENTRASTNTVGDADDITGFTPELENAPRHTFRESDTGKDVLKREELKVHGCRFDILTDIAIHDCGERRDTSILHRNNYFLLLSQKVPTVIIFANSCKLLRLGVKAQGEIPAWLGCGSGTI
jgi:hypothetical protein